MSRSHAAAAGAVAAAACGTFLLPSKDRDLLSKERNSTKGCSGSNKMASNLRIFKLIGHDVVITHEGEHFLDISYSRRVYISL